jgi:hypothetical protein
VELSEQQTAVVSKARGLIHKFGFCVLNCEMRTGKTRMGLSLCRGRTLFVTKKKAIGSILSDLEGFLGLDCTVVNYEAVKGVSGRFDTVVIDEIHNFGTFPKPSKRFKELRAISGRCDRVIMLSGTIAVESGCQMYHMMKLAKNGPFSGYSTFYKWFKEYGIPSVTYISGGQQVASYKKCQKERIMSECEPFIVSLSQLDAGFKSSVRLVEHKLENSGLNHLSATLQKEKVLTFGDEIVLGDNPAVLSAKQSMIFGGTMIAESGESFVLPEEYDPWYKAEFIKKKVDGSKKYAVFTNYINERQLILDYFGDKVTDDILTFKESSVNLWVGSIKAYSEGVDLSYCDGLIIYSLTYSAATFLQVIQRMNNYSQIGQLNVHLLLCGKDYDVYRTLREKIDS